jgi:hypothetical protein
MNETECQNEEKGTGFLVMTNVGKKTFKCHKSIRLTLRRNLDEISKRHMSLKILIRYIVFVQLDL